LVAMKMNGADMARTVRHRSGADPVRAKGI
jgi:hypothetical protein